MAWCIIISTLLWACGLSLAADQIPLTPGTDIDGTVPEVITGNKARPLHGRFLHITDFHPDPFYKAFTSADDACHRGSGDAGIYGAETTDCDSPVTLVNATFKWIQDNIRDTVDFVIWTGDSARHDEDDKIPRKEKEIVQLNELMVAKFEEVFGKENKGHDDPNNNEMVIPIVPTFGNNDIMPHNIFKPGPNFWTKKFLNIWHKFIPEEQRHAFEHGGWFFVEVIPNQLAVFSLNTMYFFNSNSAVDGCKRKSEPGYEHMEWLRIQLQFLRDRGMKAILIGHVPPARTDSKESWDETCWQKYALWMRQYRDVVVGSAYGHMNIDHFMFQDFNDIKKKTLRGRSLLAEKSRTALDDKMTTLKKTDYLRDLRDVWSDIPEPPVLESTSRGCWSDLPRMTESFIRKIINRRKSKKEKYLEEIGGIWGERYSLSLVSPSVVPNYFPTMRIVEYNISGVESPSSTNTAQNLGRKTGLGRLLQRVNDVKCGQITDCKESQPDQDHTDKKHHKKPRFVVPDPPSKSAPPGPAYSPQTFSWLGYTQYFANLTKINNIKIKLNGVDIPNAASHEENSHRGSRNKPHPNKFEFEIEYDTRNDSFWCLADLTVRSYLDLARVIGRYEPPDIVAEIGWDGQEDGIDDATIAGLDEDEEANPTLDTQKKKKKKHHKKKKHRKHHRKHNEKKQREAIRAWFTFVDRAFVGSMDDDDLKEKFEM